MSISLRTAHPWIYVDSTGERNGEAWFARANGTRQERGKNGRTSTERNEGKDTWLARWMFQMVDARVKHP